MNASCYRATFSSCSSIQRTKRNGESEILISPSLSYSTPTPTPTPTNLTQPSQMNTTVPTDEEEPPGFIIKISPEAIAFIIVGILLLVVLIILVFVLVFCLRTKGSKVDQTSSLVSSSSVVPDIEAGGECAYTSVLCSVIETIWLDCLQSM